MDLFAQLTQQFGMKPEQAAQSVGALLQAAKQHVAPATMTEITRLFPNAAQLMQNLPAAGGGLGGMFGSLLGGHMAELAKLVSQFDAIGIDKAQLAPLAKTVFSYLQTHLSADAKADIEKLLGMFTQGH